jgi:hypothetical protein
MSTPVMMISSEGDTAVSERESEGTIRSRRLDHGPDVPRPSSPGALIKRRGGKASGVPPAANRNQDLGTGTKAGTGRLHGSE